MTFTVPARFRLPTLAFALTLALTACGSDDTGAPAEDSPTPMERPEAPEATEQETALAETLEADFEVTETATLEEQWPDLTAMTAALASTEEPDLCQQAGAAQYDLIVETKPPTVLAAFDAEAVLDEHASGETVTVFWANEHVTTDQLHEVHQNTDTACVEEYESAIDHETTQAEAAGDSVDVHTWQVVASDQLTGRMIDVINDELFVRYAAAYPPQVLAADLDDDAAEEFNEAATERALDVFEAASAQ